MTRCCVVDDVPMITRLVVRLLQKSGRFEARGFESGDEMLRALDESPEAVDLLITDLQMAGMDGVELARRVRLRFPDVRVILISGKATYLATHTPEEAGVDAFLAKPFTCQELEAVIMEVMDGAGPGSREHSAGLLAAVA
jgi:CheY-like chemotaxis protein